MALEVARIVQDWLDDEDVKWEATLDVVEWARAYGTDLQRAWAECRRADFMMAIAGACRVDARIVVRAACSAAREALAFVPAKLALPRKAIYLAETHRPGDHPGGGIPGGRALSDATMTLLDKRIAEAERLQQALQAAAPHAIEKLGHVAMGAMREVAVQKVAVTGDAAGIELLPPELLAMTAVMLERALKEKAVVKLQARTAAFHRMVASAHAIRAAASSLTVASSADIASNGAILAAAIVTQEQATDDALARLFEAAAIGRRSGARVFSEAALVFEHAAGAFSQAAAASDRAWASTIAKTMTAMLYIIGGADLDATDPDMYRRALDAHIEQMKVAKLSEHADRLRAVVPWSALHPPQDEIAREAAIRRDPLGALRSSLTVLEPLTRFLGDAGAADALEMAAAMLNTTGPVNKKAVAQALHTVHERVAAMFHRRAGEEHGPAREEANAATASAREAMRELDAVLAALGTEEPN